MKVALDSNVLAYAAGFVAVSANAGCNLLLSEDMQDGFAWRGLTIVNPFAASPHPILRGLLGG